MKKFIDLALTVGLLTVTGRCAYEHNQYLTGGMGLSDKLNNYRLAEVNKKGVYVFGIPTALLAYTKFYRKKVFV